MYYMYKLRGFDYVSLYQNHLSSSVIESITAHSFYRDEFSFGSSVINQEITIELISKIAELTNSSNYLLWDACRLSHKPIHSLRQLSNLHCQNGYKCIIFLFECKELADLTKQEIELDKRASIHNLDESGLFFFYGDEVEKENIQRILSLKDVRKSINDEICRYLFEELKSDDLIPAPIYSSNIYANHYFNAKRLFCNNKVFNLAIYQMALLLVESLRSPGDKFDAFVCASVNGACISSALSVLIKKPVIFLRNVGPHIAVSDERMIERIIAGKKYVFVFDFMCMGTEYHRIKMLCNIQHAKIRLSIGISHYKLPATEKITHRTDEYEEVAKPPNICTLFDINKFEDYYKCFVEKRDCLAYLKAIKEQKE